MVTHKIIVVGRKLILHTLFYIFFCFLRLLTHSYPDYVFRVDLDNGNKRTARFAHDITDC